MQQPTTPPSSLHTVSTGARTLSCPESTVRYYVRKGRLRPIATTPTGIMLFNPSDIEALRRELEKDD